MYQSGLKAVVDAAYRRLLHAKQKLSLFMIAYGVVHADRLSIATVGSSMARQFGKVHKHGIKQVDRCLSNGKLTMAKLFAGYVPLVVGTRSMVLVTLDWTDFDDDDHTTLCASLVTRTKRATPLVWMTVKKSGLKNRQRWYEKQLLARLRDALPAGVQVVLLADRGFGDVALYDYIRSELGYHFIIRFRPNIYVERAGWLYPAGFLVPRNGRIRVLQDTTITAEQAGPWTVVLVKAAGMKEPWCLATSLHTDNGRRIVQWYGRRFECEEAFRDIKDRRYGYGLRSTRIADCQRRDRFLLLFALASLIHTTMGAASERTGADAAIRANTARQRTHSLLRQGRELLGNLADHIYEPLEKAFSALLSALICRGLHEALR